MSFEDAVTALEGARDSELGESSNESLFSHLQERPAETQQADPQPSAPQGSNESTGAAPQPEADTFDGGQFNPDSLPPELQAGWKQLQAAYTQKTQTLAEQRRQFEQLGEPDAVAQAVELYQKVQDPSNWAQLHQELSEALAQQGTAQPMAHPQAPQVPQSTDLNHLVQQLQQDPDLAPVAQIVDSLQQQVASANQQVEGFQQQLNQAVEAARAEQMQMAMIGEIQRQDAIVRDSYPHYGDEDINTVYELALAHDGNLVEAAKVLDGYRSHILSGYVNGKQTIANTPMAAPQGGNALTQPQYKPKTLQEATDVAMETLKAAGLDTLDI